MTTHVGHATPNEVPVQQDGPLDLSPEDLATIRNVFCASAFSLNGRG